MSSERHAGSGARGHSTREGPHRTGTLRQGRDGTAPTGSAPRGDRVAGAAMPGNSPAALPAGDGHGEDVEGEEDAQAEEHAAHIGLRCAEPGQVLRGSGSPRGPATGPLRSPAPPSPSQAYRLWRETPSPPASSAGCADPRGHLEEGAGGHQPCCPARGSCAGRPPPLPGWGSSARCGCHSSPHPQHHSPVPPWPYLGRRLWRGGSRAEPPRTPHPPSSPPPPRRSCCWGNPSSAVAVTGGRETGVSGAQPAPTQPGLPGGLRATPQG